MAAPSIEPPGGYTVYPGRSCLYAACPVPADNQKLDIGTHNPQRTTRDLSIGTLWVRVHDWAVTSKRRPGRAGQFRPWMGVPGSSAPGLSAIVGFVFI